MKIDWKRKLSSRKFWVALTGFIAPLLIMLGIPESQVAQVVALIMSGSVLIAYILAEGYIDAQTIDCDSKDPKD